MRWNLQLFMSLACIYFVTLAAGNEILINCLDPECSTPFSTGELITDLPEAFLQKGSVVDVYATSEKSKIYRIKAGARFYDVSHSILRITKMFFENRSMVSVTVAPLPIPKNAAEKADLSFNGEQVFLNDHQSKPDNSQQQQVIQESPDAGGSAARPIISNQHLKEPSEFKNEERASTKKENNSKPNSPVEQSGQGSDSSPFQKSVDVVDVLRKSNDTKTYPATNSTADAKIATPTVEQIQHQDSHFPSLQDASNAKSNPPNFIVPSEGASPSVNNTQASITNVTEKDTSAVDQVDRGTIPNTLLQENANLRSSNAKPPHSHSTNKVQKNEGMITLPPADTNTGKVTPGDLSSTSQKSSEQSPPVVATKPLLSDSKIKISAKPHEEHRVQQPLPSQETPSESANEGGVEHVFTEEHDHQIHEFVSQEKVHFEAASPSNNREQYDLTPTVENDNTLQENAPLGSSESDKSIQEHTFASILPDSDEKDIIPQSQSPPLADIITKSPFFHCLSHASNGTGPSFNQESSTSLEENKSLLAGIVLFCARHYFNGAQHLLLKLPPVLVSSLDNLFSFTFHLPLVFFTSWVLFVLSALTTWLLVKLLNRLIFVGFIATSSSILDDPSKRSLPEWLAIEENANLLADSLADKEEAYARLIVWSAKVSERYENQTRHRSTLETRVEKRLRDAEAELVESLEEKAELRKAHDALVEQLATVKTEAAFTSKALREEIVSLENRLEECTRRYNESIIEKEKSNDVLMSALRDEKAVLVREVKSYQSQLENASKNMNELRETNLHFEEELAARDRELSSLREAFIELKSAELKNKKRHAEEALQAELCKKQNDEKASTDGWEVEDEIEVEDIIEEFESNQQGDLNEVDKGELESALNDFLEVGRLKVALEEAEKQARIESAAREQEAELRTQLQTKLDELKGENAGLSQKLRVAMEDCDAAKKKLEILSDYFKERESVIQRDLGRQAYTESESAEQLGFLQDKQRSMEVEVKTLRDQLSSSRRELAEAERASRRQISELDKRLHEKWMSAKTLENLVKDLRNENSMLRQKMFIGERATVHQLLGGIPPPPPPPPPPSVLAMASAKSPELRSLSRQSEKSASSHHHNQMRSPPPPPFLPFPQIPLTGPGGSQFIPPPPPPPPHGVVPPGLFLSQRQADGSRHSPMVSFSWDTSRSQPKTGSSNSGSNRSSKNQEQHQ